LIDVQLPDLFFDILGWAGSLLLVISILQTKIDRLRWLNFAACAVLIVYNIWLVSWPMVAMNTAMVAINLFTLIRLRRRPEGGPITQQPSTFLPALQHAGERHPVDETELAKSGRGPSTHRA
jgi:hypothetical protein